MRITGILQLHNIFMIHIFLNMIILKYLDDSSNMYP